MVKKWIAGAIKRPGALRAAAKRAGALKNGISKTWLRAKAKAPGRIGRQARLAITLSRLPRPGRAARARGGRKAARTRARRR